MFTACFVFAFSLNEIWSIILDMNKKKDIIRYRINVMNRYMRDRGITVPLKSKVNAYLAHFYHTKNVRDKELEKEILLELTPSLKRELFYEIYGFIFRQH